MSLNLMIKPTLGCHPPPAKYLPGDHHRNTIAIKEIGVSATFQSISRFLKKENKSKKTLQIEA